MSGSRLFVYPDHGEASTDRALPADLRSTVPRQNRYRDRIAKGFIKPGLVLHHAAFFKINTIRLQVAAGSITDVTSRCRIVV